MAYRSKKKIIQKVWQTIERNTVGLRRDKNDFGINFENDASKKQIGKESP